MLQNRSQSFEERTTQISHTALTVALTPILINARVMIPLNSASANALNAYLYAGQISDAATANVTIAANDPCYWDNTNSVFTNVASGNTRCGNFLEAVSAAAPSGLIAFNAFQL